MSSFFYRGERALPPPFPLDSLLVFHGPLATHPFPSYWVPGSIRIP